MKKEKKKKGKKGKSPCICCGTLISFLLSDCFLCCVCDTITDLSTPLISNPFSFIGIENNGSDSNVPGSLNFINSLKISLLSGNLEEGRALIFNGYSSQISLGCSFKTMHSVAINSDSFDSFYSKINEMKCSFFIQTLMASIDHLVKRPGKSSSIRWIIIALLTPFLSRKKTQMEGNFHHSLARRLFSLLRGSIMYNLNDKPNNELCILLDTLPPSYLRRLSELANWTLNIRIGKVSGTFGYSFKGRAKILARDWVILGASFMIQAISESNSRQVRIEPSELYNVALDLLPLEVVLADWQLSGLATLPTTLFKDSIRLCACGQCQFNTSLFRCLKSKKIFNYETNGKITGFYLSKSLIANFPGILSLGIKSQLIESELIPNGSFNGLVPLRIKVVRSPRETMLQSSMYQVLNASVLQLRGRVKIEFENEPGVDAGGLLREWLQLLVNLLTHPAFKVFGCGANGSSYEPSAPCTWFSFSENSSTDSHINEFDDCPDKNEISEKTLAYARFFGILLGIACNNGIVLEHKLPFALFKKLLFPESNPPNGVASQQESPESLTLDDLSEICPQLSRGLGQLLDFQQAQNKDLIFEECFFLQFTVGSFNKNSSIYISELIEGGSDIPVTIDNRDIFVSLYIEHIFNVRPKILFSEFRIGFYMAISGTSLSLLSPKELQQLLSGDADEISVDLLRSVTLYEGFLTPVHQVTKWFWEILSSFSPAMKRKFLVFVSGVGRLPAVLAATGAAGHSVMPNQTGPWIFRALGLELDWISSSGGQNRPLGRTCFNQLCIYRGYPDIDTFKRLLISAIMDSEGFGIE